MHNIQARRQLLVEIEAEFERLGNYYLTGTHCGEPTPSFSTVREWLGDEPEFWLELPWSADDKRTEFVRQLFPESQLIHPPQVDENLAAVSD